MVLVINCVMAVSGCYSMIVPACFSKKTESKYLLKKLAWLSPAHQHTLRLQRTHVFHLRKANFPALGSTLNVFSLLYCCVCFINRNLQYITREGQEEHCGTFTNYLEKYKKKVTLLDYFKNYMNEHLLKAGGPRGTAVEANEISRLPYLRTWFRTRRAIVLHLSNGILQVKPSQKNLS